MTAGTGASVPLPEDTLLALAANVMVLMVTRHGDVTSNDVVDTVLRSLDACGYDVVKRPTATGDLGGQQSDRSREAPDA